MKARLAYPLLFLLPSAMAAFLSAFVAAGVAAGILWLFVYGDNTWPQAAGNAVMGFAVVVSIAVLAMLLFASYSFGKRREASGGLARRHVAFAIIVSVLLPALALLHQWQVGNLG
jgi:hypothetical protein